MVTRARGLVREPAALPGLQEALGHTQSGASVTAGLASVELTADGMRAVASLLRVPYERLEALIRVIDGIGAVDLDRLNEILHEAGGIPEQRQNAFVSPEEASVILGVSRPTVVRWANQGLLADHHVGSHHRYEREAVLALQRRRRAAAEAAAERALARRKRVVSVGVDLDVEPTPEEMMAAGRALRQGDRAAAESVLVRSRRAEARKSAERAARSSAPESEAE